MLPMETVPLCPPGGGQKEAAATATASIPPSMYISVILYACKHGHFVHCSHLVVTVHMLTCV